MSGCNLIWSDCGIIPGQTPVHLWLPQKLYPECAKQAEEKNQRWWRRVSWSRCRSSWGSTHLYTYMWNGILCSVFLSTNVHTVGKRFVCVYVCQVDLFQLQVNTLRRYKRHYKIQTRPGLNKAQLAEVHNHSTHYTYYACTQCKSFVCMWESFLPSPVTEGNTVSYNDIVSVCEWFCVLINTNELRGTSCLVKHRNMVNKSRINKSI